MLERNVPLFWKTHFSDLFYYANAKQGLFVPREDLSVTKLQQLVCFKERHCILLINFN